jgi:hypothetical protein
MRIKAIDQNIPSTLDVPETDTLLEEPIPEPFPEYEGPLMFDIPITTTKYRVLRVVAVIALIAGGIFTAVLTQPPAPGLVMSLIGAMLALEVSGSADKFKANICRALGVITLIIISLAANYLFYRGDRAAGIVITVVGAPLVTALISHKSTACAWRWLVKKIRPSVSL